MNNAISRYTFASGWRKVTVKASTYEQACLRARGALDYRMEREGVEAPVAHSLTLLCVVVMPAKVGAA